MVLSFIDIKNGTTFNGSKPFVFWFEDGQSVNLIYIKKVPFISDLQSEQARVEADTPFFLIDPALIQSSQQETVSNESYYDLESVKTSVLQTTGISYNGKYIHMLYIGCESDSAGEYTADFNIGGSTFSVGADFYNEDEILKSNLENLGIEIPQTVQKAIYESNVHEEATDNILLNRKWKELLLEYWKITACKGSYQSLISSVKWFEYGDLIKICEYWKRCDIDRRKLMSSNIEQILSDLFREQLAVLSKTTYIGLYLALEKASATEREADVFPFYNSSQVYQVPTGDGANAIQPTPTQYDGTSIFMLNEDNPVLHRIASVWSVSDLSLKMTLVGNFFATYFMPIHLDLIHSTIENIVFTNLIKTMASGSSAREDWVHCTGSFQCNSVKDDSNWHIQPVDCQVSSLTILGIKDTLPDGSPKVLGYNLTENNSTGSQYFDPSAENQDSIDLWDAVFASVNRFKAYGAPVRFDVEIRDNVLRDDFLKCARISWTIDGESAFDYRDPGVYIKQTEEKGALMYKFSFNLLFEKAGKYELSITFESSRGIWYSKRFSVNILDDTDNRIEVYKVVRGDIGTWKKSELKEDAGELVFFKNEEIESDVNEFMFAAVEDTTDMRYAQFIHAGTDNLNKQVGLNHVIMVPVPETDDDPISLSYADHKHEYIIDQTSLSNLLHDLTVKFPNYWWYLKSRDMWMKNTNAAEPFDSTFKGDVNNTRQRKILFGMRKYFSTDEAAKILSKKRYKYGSLTFEVTVKQNGNTIHTTVKNLSNGQTKLSVCDLADELEINLFGYHKTKIKIYPDTIYGRGERDTDISLGSPEMRVHINNYNGRKVDEDRFVPLFHRLEKITEKNYELGQGETAVIVPRFPRSKQDKIDELTIAFRHCGTNEITYKKTGVSSTDDSDGNPTCIGIKVTDPTNNAQEFAAHFTDRAMTRGFYDVITRYKYGEKWQEEVLEGAFKIREPEKTYKTVQAQKKVIQSRDSVLTQNRKLQR